MTKYVVEVRRQSKNRPGLTVEIEFPTQEEAEAYIQTVYDDYVKGQFKWIMKPSHIV